MVHLTTEAKLEMCKDRQRGLKWEAIEKKYKVSERTGRNILKAEAQLRQQLHQGTITAATKNNRQSPFTAIEAQLLETVELARRSGLPVTQDFVKVRALSLRDQLLQQQHGSPAGMDDAQRQAWLDFSASSGWLNRFIKRHGIKSTRLHGQGGSVNDASIAEGLAIVRQELAKYAPDNIYNVDETGMFYRLLPRQSYVTKTENKKTVRGTKAMDAKDRLTAYIATNASGTHKIPLSVIGKSKKPRCFGKVRPTDLPATYFSQTNAWSDTVVFKCWFRQVFLPAVRSRTAGKVLLLIDNCGPHATALSDPRRQVKTLALPPNCTAKHQPMDAGIIAAWKKRTKYELLGRMITQLPERAALRADAEQRHMKTGTKGLNEGHLPHVLDAMEVGRDCWDAITPATIAHCWLKCDILPAAVSAQVLAKHPKAKRGAEAAAAAAAGSNGGSDSEDGDGGSGSEDGDGGSSSDDGDVGRVAGGDRGGKRRRIAESDEEPDPARVDAGDYDDGTEAGDNVIMLRLGEVLATTNIPMEVGTEDPELVELVEARSHFAYAMRTGNLAEAVTEWVSVEDSADCKEAVRNDIAAALASVVTAAPLLAAAPAQDDSDADDVESQDVKPAAAATFADASPHIAWLEQAAVDCDLPQAVGALRAVKRAFLTLAPKKTRQLSMKDFV